MSDRISWCSIIALGIGGYPRGRIIEVYGPESSGKTTLTLHAIRVRQQRSGGSRGVHRRGARLDVQVRQGRSASTPSEAARVAAGQRASRPSRSCEMLVRSGAVDLVVIDSVAALVPKAEIEGDMGDSHMGLQARLMSQALRKLTGITHRTGTTLIFINQLRQKIGVTFGNPETTTGGNALKFYASVRLDVRRTGQVKIGEEHVGSCARG
jgi:recombination protein RecA